MTEEGFWAPQYAGILHYFKKVGKEIRSACGLRYETLVKHHPKDGRKCSACLQQLSKIEHANNSSFSRHNSRARTHPLSSIRDLTHPQSSPHGCLRPAHYNRKERS